jgi:hypothetical protein
MKSYELPNSNVLLSGVAGYPTTLRGTDPLPYASATVRSWTGGAGVDPAQADFWTVPTDASGPPAAPSLLARIGWGAAFVLLALVLVGVGTYAFVAGD